MIGEPAFVGRLGRAALAAVAAVGIAAASGSNHQLQPAADPIRTLVQGRGELECLYRPGYAALWLDAAGNLTDDGRAALSLLARAAEEGLDPDDYRVNAPGSPPPSGMSAETIARADIGISGQVLRYLHELREGRLESDSIGMPDPVRIDACLAVRTAIAGRSLATLGDSARPECTTYRQLRPMLLRYRTLTGVQPVAAVASRVIHPGDSFSEIGSLMALLEAFDDLQPPRIANTTASYSGSIVDAVRAFQHRHGLTPDGVIGKRTQAALAVPMTRRIRQIELALERTRTLCRIERDRVILVNIPMFRLWAFERDGTVVISQKVIVGRAHRTETPRFAALLQNVIFRPAWNVPKSILRGEILPLLARDPDYLGRQQMELVDAAGRSSSAAAVTPEILSRLQHGTLRVRQRAGPHNALGLIKFDFPNRYSVYMHGTPAQTLFARDRRDFSHGCLRVEDPTALAEWVLNDPGEWNRARIETAIHADASRHVAVATRVLVVLFYMTAMVLPDTGVIAFADDIYGQDASLERALRNRQTGR